MQSIIVAINFSPVSDNAMRYAIEAVKVIKGKIILFHLFKVSSHVANSLVGTNVIDDMLEQRKQKMKKLAAVLIQEHHVEIEPVVRMGDFNEVVKEIAETYNSTMLVLGMPKKTFEQDLLGNTTTAAIDSFMFPVLSIPESATFNGIKKILFACDLTRGVHATVLSIVKQYADLFNAEVEVFYVGDVVKSIEKDAAIKDSLGDVGYVYKNVQSASVVKAIQQEAEDINADILIMTPHKYGFWSSILHRSKTRAIASNGKIPLISIAY